MKRTITAASLAGLLLAAPAFAQGGPNFQQLLGGLMTGNQSQDQALREAYERGYRNGREDEARQMRASQDRGSSRDDRRGGRYDRDSDRPYPPQRDYDNR